MQKEIRDRQENSVLLLEAFLYTSVSFVTPEEVSLPALIVEEELGNTVEYV